MKQARGEVEMVQMRGHSSSVQRNIFVCSRAIPFAISFVVRKTVERTMMRGERLRSVDEMDSSKWQKADSCDLTHTVITNALGLNQCCRSLFSYTT